MYLAKLWGITYNKTMTDTAKLNIIDSQGRDVIGYVYSGKNCDLYKIFLDVEASSEVGDSLVLTMKMDTINRSRIRNFLAIQELYDYAFKNNPNNYA